MDNDMPLGALVSIIHRTHFAALNQMMQKYDLTAGHFHTLIHLSREQNITQDALACRFHHNKATIARSVQKLEEKGFVRRITNPDNRREVRIFLTEKGEQIVPEIIRMDHEWEDLVFSGLSADERSQVKEHLCKIAKNSFNRAHENGRRENKCMATRPQK